MRPRNILAILTMFVCLSIFGQQTKTVSPQETTVETITHQQGAILQLQAENEAMQKQMDKMEKEIEFYREDVRTKVAELEASESRWTAWICLFVTLLAGGLGVAVPFFINNRNDKHLKEQLKVATEKTEKAEKALAYIEELKTHISTIEKKINEYSIAAEKAAKKAKASQLFTEAFSKEDSSIAIKLYTEAINLNPDFVEAYNNRGALKYKEGDFSNAMSDYDKAISLKPDYAEAYNNRAVLKLNMGDQEGAMTDYNKAISLKPQYAEAYNNRGNLKCQKGDTLGAMADYDMAISLKPDYAEAYNNRGSLKSLKEDFLGAIADYGKAISLKSDYAEAYYRRGFLKSRMDDHLGAISDYNKVIFLIPDYARAYNNRAITFLALGKYVEALDDANTAIEKEKTNHLFYDTRGEVLMKMDRNEDALIDFDKALSLDANFIESLENRAKCYRKLAEKEQDPATKAIWVAKAKADEKKVESLKNDNR